MKYSNEELIKRIEEANKNVSKLTHITDKSSLTAEDKMKISLCKHFVQFKNEKKLALNAMSELTKIPSSHLSNITNYKIKSYTIDRLIQYLTVLSEKDPKVVAYLGYVTEVFEVPTMGVGCTKRLTKSIKDVAEKGSESTFLSR